MRLIYDCEIIRLIPPDNYFVACNNYPDSEAWFNCFGDGYQYCAGWNDFENMGIAVIGVCNIDTEELYYFSDRDHNLKRGKYLEGFNHFPGAFVDFDAITEKGEIELIEWWGFNSLNFDDKLCRANGIDIYTNHDLLCQIRLAAFGSSHWEDQPRGSSYSLGAIAKVNGMAKSGSGELAPKLWQDGKHQEVIDYCLNDCLITARLIKLFERGALIDPNTGEKLNVKD
jgi:DEAD/DEAH box helicase domain-containing protein